MNQPNKRPKVSQVSEWHLCYADDVSLAWKDEPDVSVTIEQGCPFPTFLRVTYVTYGTDEVTKSKLFYGEDAWSDVFRFVRILGFYHFAGIDLEACDICQNCRAYFM